MTICSLLTEILKFLFSFDHNIECIVHHPMSRVGQCCFVPKMSKKIEGGEWYITQHLELANAASIQKQAKKFLVGCRVGLGCGTSSKSYITLTSNPSLNFHSDPNPTFKFFGGPSPRTSVSHPPTFTSSSPEPDILRWGWGGGYISQQSLLIRSSPTFVQCSSLVANQTC